MANNKVSVGTAMISAVSLKLCCWGPLLLTGIVGISGSSAYFSWLTIFKPYLLTIAFLSLGFAFYQVYKKKDIDDCSDCETKKVSFFKSKVYIWLVAIFVVVMTLVSYYPQLFHQSFKKEIVVVNKKDTQSLKLHIEGMVCTSCELNINRSVSKIDGVINVRSSYKEGISIVEFDTFKTNSNEIIEIIKSKGYIIKNRNNE
ncbi:cation transporter [Flavobacteriaceae bacterium AH-315-B10]|nr:cation transporter [Flavobacteriaceae bacterium AH-315-B10]